MFSDLFSLFLEWSMFPSTVVTPVGVALPKYLPSSTTDIKMIFLLSYRSQKKSMEETETKGITSKSISSWKPKIIAEVICSLGFFVDMENY